MEIDIKFKVGDMVWYIDRKTLKAACSAIVKLSVTQFNFPDELLWDLETGEPYTTPYYFQNKTKRDSEIFNSKEELLKSL